MKSIAVFPGSFDPFTVGHESVVRRALPMFDQIVIAIGYNSSKSGFFSLEQRQKWIEAVFADEPKVSVDKYEGLTVNYCRDKQASFILRGLRTAADFEYERAIAQVNSAMVREVETVFMLTRQEHSSISSSIVREIIRHGGDVSMFLPDAIQIGD